MKIFKRFLTLVTAVGMTLTFFTGCGTSAEEATKKLVGSRDTEGFSSDIQTYESAEKLTGDSELVVIGRASTPIEVSEVFEGETKYASKTEITVTEVLKGDTSKKSVYVLQAGKPNSDNYETKIEDGGEYVLFLNSKTFNGDTVYDCTGIEQGIFEVKSDKKLYSFADFGSSVKFNNKPVGELKKQVVN